MGDKYTSIILVVNKAELSIAFNLYNKLTHIGKRVVILTKDNAVISDKKFSVRSFQFYQNFFPTTYSNIIQQAYDLFCSLAKEQVSKNLTLRELTKYKGVSLWDLSVQDIRAELIYILYNFNMMETVLNFEKPCEVYILNDVSRLAKILELICQKKQIHFFIEKKIHRKIVHPSKFFKKFIIFLKKIKWLLVTIYFSFINLMKARNLNKKCRVIFFTPVKRYLGSILPVIFKYKAEERIVVNTFLSGSAKELKKNEIFYLDFYGYKLYSLYNRHAQRLLSKIQAAIIKNSSFYKRLLYKELPIGELLSNVFEKLIYDVFPNNIEKVDIIRKIISLHRPEVVVLTGFSADVISITKSLSIPIVDIQEGHVGEFCYFSPIITDAVVVYGNYWKEYLLKKQNVNPNKILVTGPPKFDAVINGRFNIKDSSKISNSIKSEKIVIFASTIMTCELDMVEWEAIEQFRAVCQAMKNIEAYLIVKLHPTEKEVDTYKKMVQQAGLKNYSIAKDIEMAKLLMLCDLLITHTSTTGYEAVLLDKDVISLTACSKFEPQDIWDFGRFDAATIVHDLNDLEKCIRDVLFNPETRAKLKEGRKKYMYDHAYKLDGNASGRVKEIIDNFISK